MEVVCQFQGIATRLENDFLKCPDNFEDFTVVLYIVRPARMRSSVPLLEPGSPRFFGGMENNE